MRSPNKASLAWLLAASLLLSGSATRPGARILFARGRSGIAAPAVVSAADTDLTQYVNTYVGSAGADMGNTFPGAALRFGMIQWSPDTPHGFDRSHAGSYLYSDNAIRGFSLTHLSGPGCQIMGDVLITPVPGPITTSPRADPERYAAKFSHSHEQASPGYYSVALDNGTKVQLAVTTRAGIGSFAVPASASSGLLFNVGRNGNGVESASIDIAGDHSITGSVSSGRFCGMKQNKYTVCFAAEYSWMVPYNLRGLFDLMGGNAKVVERLDKFFTQLNATDTKPFAWVGNVPSFAIPWAYDFAGAPWGTQSVARRVELELSSARPDGEPGNDDLGAMSAWYVFAALGAYPAIPGVGGLALNSPLFPAATIQLGNGSRVEIEAENAAAQNPYVLSLSVNGQPYEKTWLPYELLSRGATLRFKLGSLPNKDWGRKPEEAPPSFSEGSD